MSYLKPSLRLARLDAICNDTHTSVAHGTALQGTVGVHGKSRTRNRLKYSSRWHTPRHNIQRTIEAYGYHIIFPHPWCSVPVFLHVVFY
jgi:hypothetical protein